MFCQTSLQQVQGSVVKLTQISTRSLQLWNEVFKKQNDDSPYAAVHVGLFSDVRITTTRVPLLWNLFWRKSAAGPPGASEAPGLHAPLRYNIIMTGPRSLILWPWLFKGGQQHIFTLGPPGGESSRGCTRVRFEDCSRVCCCCWRPDGWSTCEVGEQDFWQSRVLTRRAPRPRQKQSKPPSANFVQVHVWGTGVHIQVQVKRASTRQSSLRADLLLKRALLCS